MLHTTDKLMPTTSKSNKHCPYTPKFISAVWQPLNLNLPLDAAIFACLTMCFYTSARLGEFTVQTLSSFNPNTDVTTQHLSHDQDWNSFRVTVLHLPTTKTAGAASWTSTEPPRRAILTPQQPLSAISRSTNQQKFPIWLHTGLCTCTTH